MTGLGRNEVADDPFAQFEAWLSEARAADEDSEWTDAMTLATSSLQGGAPSARAVLLRGFDERGFVFYTDHRSRKAAELEDNPRAAVVFLWERLRRQVRAEGTVERADPDESDAYWRTRPRGAQIAAWASTQSSVLSDRGELELQVAQTFRRFEDREVPRPAHWGGYRVVPQAFEFWQGRDDRLHDRIRYRLVDHRWVLERLSP